MVLFSNHSSSFFCSSCETGSNMYMQVFLTSVLCALVHNSGAAIYGSVYVLPKNDVGVKQFQLPFINGNKNQVQNITFILFNGTDDYDQNRAILTLSDFPELLEVEMNRMSLGRLPSFFNVPKLQAISAHSNSLQIINKEWFGDTTVEIVFLDRNRIRKIDDGSFGEMMTVVDVSCNELTGISAKWFRKPSNMELFALKHNKITTLPTNLLRGFTNLTELNLSYNHIVTVGTAALTGPRNMNTINLSVNLISDLPATVMQNKKHYIQYLNLSYNRLNFFTAALLDKLEVVVFEIYGNPWHCTCLHNVERWMSKKGVIFSPLPNASDPICIFPLSYADTCIEVIDKELYREYVKSLTPPPAPTCEIDASGYKIIVVPT